MSKINLKVLHGAISQAVDSREIREKVRRQANERFEEAKASMLENFQNHPVTTEIEAGAGSENTSNTLGGYGNLYSFIGFEAGLDPTLQVREYLEKSTKLNQRVSFEKKDLGGVFHLQANIPSVEELESITPSPWDTKSWIRGIERGISGLGYYLYSKIRFFENSRSNTAIQSDYKLRNLGYKPVKYMSNIIDKFKTEIGRIKI